MKTTTYRLSIVTVSIAALMFATTPKPARAGELPSTPDGTIEAVAKALADSHPEILWEALPPSYRTDITEITHPASVQWFYFDHSHDPDRARAFDVYFAWLDAGKPPSELRSHESWLPWRAGDPP